MLTWKDVRTEDAELGDAEGLREVLAQFNQGMRRSVAQVEQERMKAENVTVTDGSVIADLQDLLRRTSLMTDGIIGFYGTWAKALSARKHGLRICHSGDRQTPPLTPGDGTSDVQRIPRGVAYGQDAWNIDKIGRVAVTDSTHDHNDPVTGDPIQFLEKAGGDPTDVGNFDAVTTYPPVTDLIFLQKSR